MESRTLILRQKQKEIRKERKKEKGTVIMIRKVKLKNIWI